MLHAKKSPTIFLLLATRQCTDMQFVVLLTLVTFYHTYAITVLIFAFVIYAGFVIAGNLEIFTVLIIALMVFAIVVVTDFLVIA